MSVDKLNPRAKTDKIITKHNEIITLINEGNYGNPKTIDEIESILNADNTKELMVRNIDTGQIEYCFVANGQIIRRVLG